MLAKINSIHGALLLLALALVLSGCTPAGPRALLKGKKYLDRGDVPAAVAEFKRATTLLSTNANAWNYYGVALQRAGQPDEAATAYQNAIRLDHDLIEAHFNLGALTLEQNRPDLAKAEFTTYTLRRPNDPAGWLKLGFAQLKSGETMPAEQSFSNMHALKGDDAEFYNGMGLARMQAGKPREAAEFFAAAIQSRSNFTPALLNLATVNEQYLHDTKAALANYKAYLTLAPQAANYSDVKAIVASLEQSDAATTVMGPAVVVRNPPPPEPKSKPVVVAISHPAPTPRPEPEENHETQVVERPAPSQTYTVPPPITQTQAPPKAAQVTSQPTFITASKTNPPGRPMTIATRPPAKLPAKPPAKAPATNVVAKTEPVEVPMPDEEAKQGFWHRLFGGSNPSYTAKSYHDESVTPILGTNDDIAGTKPEEEKPVDTKPATVSAISRYIYSSPTKPAPGDRRSAEGAFTRARLAEQDENWADAEQWYQTAADSDPSWFEAQYNTGVIAHRLHTYSVALPRYELALAIQPDSVDARYNFALALKAAGYPLDSAEELKKILAANPDEVRAHLALANLCAQSLHDIPQARQHYLRVLDLQPNNPQAADIRFWLSGNAK